jgi:cyanophycinase
MQRKNLKIPRLLTLVLLLAGIASRASAGDNGVVIAMGGGNGTPEIYEKWRSLGGGKNAHVVLIPTANNPGEDIAPVVHGLKQVFGVQDVSVLDTKDRTKADSVEFVAPLKQATFVFIDGGRQWRLADAYLGTRVERELRNVLKRGGVIAGSSAGASILASYLVRGDPSGPEIVMAKGHERGFGFLPNCAIDQHVSERHREHDLEPVVAAHPNLLGIGIDPNTIIVVQANQIRGDRQWQGHYNGGWSSTIFNPVRRSFRSTKPEATVIQFGGESGVAPFFSNT